ncbi:MAG: DEAD/DEAH box helicase family protein [Planctomycetaceae bacterium]|nr:DEAD/DEAH box helicase family protein [Planctomycetaceae bacterium]
MSVGITKKVKVLRPYQARIIKNVLRDPGHLLVEQPTGSGKTLQVVALTGVLLETRYDRIIICAPQQQIEEGFTGGQGGLGYGLVRFPDSSNTIRVPDGLIVASREVSYGSRARIQGYLAMPQSHALACTHAALSTLDVSVLPADCSGVLLVVDEAHHAPAEGLGRFLDEFELRGGVLHYYTATPWRQDGKPVVRPEMRVIRRSLAQHMAEGWAPAHLSHELVLVGSPGAKVNAQQFYGESALPTSFEHDMVDKLVGKWRADGEPKTIIRVPPVRGGAHGLNSSLQQGK